MRSLRAPQAGVANAALLIAMTLGPLTEPLHGAQLEGPTLRDPGRQPCCQPAVGAPQEFAHLEVRDTELVLTNVSDRPIVAWTVRQVTRITEGNEGYSSITRDFHDYPLVPDGSEDLLFPGESVTLERPQEPWIREDLKEPEYTVYFDIGALVFENAEWVGVPRFVDRIFEGRLRVAKDALTALETIASGADDLPQLPLKYQRRLQDFSSRADALRAIQGEATATYNNAVANLRPEDLAKLPPLGERIP